jgi:hypothetical protein
MALEVRRVETEFGETGLAGGTRIDVTYEVGFETPSGGWVKFSSVPEATVQAAEDNAKAASQPASGPTDLSQADSPPVEPAAPPEPATDTPAAPAEGEAS